MAAGRCILVVDHEVGVHTLLRSSLEAAGHQMIEARDATRAELLLS